MPAVHRMSANDITEKEKRADTTKEAKRRIMTSESPQRLCRVCGQEAAGIYFSALVCLPCKSFFLRCANGKEPNVKCEKKNCKINAATRTICKFCRYKRCLAIGMTRKELPEKADAVNGQELCRVCGDVANGVHFGAVTCEGCKNFFRRSLSEETVICKKGGNCVVNLKTRKGCRGCRYRKCIAAGMSKEAKKPGRRNRPVEIFTNTVQALTVGVPEANEHNVNNEEVFASQVAGSLEMDADLMGHSYDAFNFFDPTNQELTREYRLELELCSSTSSACSTDTDAFNLIDDMTGVNYIPDQVVNQPHHTGHNTMWHSNNGMLTNGSSFITLEPMNNSPEGANVDTPSTPESAYMEDFTSTSTLSPPVWNCSSDIPLAPSKIVIATFDSECPMHCSNSCYSVTACANDTLGCDPNNNNNNSSLDYTHNQVTDFDDDPLMLSEALDDVMEFLTEELDFSPLANAAASTLTSDHDILNSGNMEVESDISQELQSSIESWFSESSQG